MDKGALTDALTHFIGARGKWREHVGGHDRSGWLCPGTTPVRDVAMVSSRHGSGCLRPGDGGFEEFIPAGTYACRRGVYDDVRRDSVPVDQGSIVTDVPQTGESNAKPVERVERSNIPVGAAALLPHDDSEARHPGRTDGSFRARWRCCHPQ